MAVALSERFHDTFFRGEQTPEAGFRYEDIFPNTLALLSMSRSKNNHEPPSIFRPQSFGEIYAAREELATLNMCIERDPATQTAYTAFLRSIDDPGQFILDKHFSGNTVPNDRRAVIVPNDYPIAMPSGVRHLVVWYLQHDDPSLDLNRVAHAISEYIITQGLTTADYIVYTKTEYLNPALSDSFIPGVSRTIDLPHAHLLVRNRRLQTSPNPEI